MDRADAVRCRLGAIQAAEPTVFRYCCARGMQNPPAATAKKLQRFETLRLLWRRYSLCSKSNPNLTYLCGAPARVVGSVVGYVQRRLGSVGVATQLEHIRWQTASPLHPHAE